MSKAPIRGLAIVQAILAIKIVWVERAQHAAFERIGELTTEQWMASFKKIYDVSRVVSWSVMALSMAALVMVSVGSKRKLATAGAVVFGLHVAMAVGLAFVNTKSEPSAWLQFAWWGSGALESAGLGLVLFSMTKRRTWPTVFAAIAVCESVLGFALGRMKELPKNAAFLFALAAATVLVSFAIIALVLSREVPEEAEAERATTEGERNGGDPLRLVAWSTFARLGAGIVATIFALLAMKDGDASSANAATTLGGLVGLVGGIALIFGLIGYGRTRTGRDHASVMVFTVVLVVIAAALDLWALSAATELFDAIAQAKNASSFWGMPSLKKLEELQDGIRWASRGQIVLGMIVVMTVASALKETASRMGAREQVERAGRVRVLAIVAAGLSFLGGLMMEQPKAGEEVLIVAGLALVIAIAMLTAWTRLLFGVADAIERPYV
ncbi:MAG: hypothetical protein ACXVEE_22910 [Polyangiales bacterium]